VSHTDGYCTQGLESSVASKQNANTGGSIASEGRQCDVINNKSKNKQIRSMADSKRIPVTRVV